LDLNIKHKNKNEKLIIFKPVNDFLTSNGRKLSFIVARIICDDDIVASYQEVHEEGEGQAEAVRGREQNAARNLEG
jgi:hypothetical protein